MKKRRWKSYGNRLTSTTGDRFTYHGDGSGNFLFYRFRNPFSWGSVACTRDEAAGFVNRLNNCSGRDVERRRKEISDNFIKEHRGKPLRRVNKIMDLTKLRIGKKVRTNSEFSGVPKGTVGTIEQASNSWPETESVAVHWNRYEGDKLTDWFSFSDLQYLDEVESL